MSESGSTTAYIEAGLWQQLFKLEHVREAHPASRAAAPGFWKKLFGKKAQAPAGVAEVFPSRFLIAAALLFDRVSFPDQRALVCRQLVASTGLLNRVPYQVPGLNILGFCLLDGND